MHKYSGHEASLFLFTFKGETSIPTQQAVSPPAEGQSSTASDAQSAGGPPPPPKDVMEALQQRLDKYQSATDQAKKEGNSSKARRMARIVKVRRIIGIAKFYKKTTFITNKIGN